MIIAEKHVGETPLELLERLRRENPALATETLSYAGRLDPMAEGAMLVLVGEKENHDRATYLGLDKEYVATFLVGVSTDTGDALGLITSVSEKTISAEDIERVVERMHALTKQTYPWFSSRVVDGLPLFDHFKAGNIDIERPTRTVSVKEAVLEEEVWQEASAVEYYIEHTIGKVHGDFRQEAIGARWQEFFKNHSGNMHTIRIRFRVSSGTYIRAFTELFPVPVTLLSLKRTRIILPEGSEA